MHTAWIHTDIFSNISSPVINPFERNELFFTNLFLSQRRKKKYSRRLSQQSGVALVVKHEHATAVPHIETAAASDCEKYQIRQIWEDARLQSAQIQSGRRFRRRAHAAAVRRVSLRTVLRTYTQDNVDNVVVANLRLLISQQPAHHRTRAVDYGTTAFQRYFTYVTGQIAVNWCRWCIFQSYHYYLGDRASILAFGMCSPVVLFNWCTRHFSIAIFFSLNLLKTIQFCWFFVLFQGTLKSLDKTIHSLFAVVYVIIIW